MLGWCRRKGEEGRMLVSGWVAVLLIVAGADTYGIDPHRCHL